MKYFYEQVKGGYRWNMLQRILNTIGIEPIGSGDVGGKTYLEFEKELTKEQKIVVDEIMADNPTYPPKPKGSVYIVRDLWNDRDAIGQEMGCPYEVYYSESELGSGNINQVELHFLKEINPTEDTKISVEYSNLITAK